jgi:hypothetical protein
LFPAGDPKDSGTYVGALDSSETTRLLDASCSAVIFTSPGYLLYKRGGAVFATLRSGDAPHDGRAVGVAARCSRRSFEISRRRTAFSFSAAQSSTKLVWFGRDGALASVKGAISSSQSCALRDVAGLRRRI